ncbi:hypothetical protein ACH5RR_015055 [Cinchona calisaya]|uniref:Uncharacterized protein n=1 Tax=Cinchona calisaya TaxID=153742 RepID=A0ABD2ZTR8_9GENT
MQEYHLKYCCRNGDRAFNIHVPTYICCQYVASSSDFHSRSFVRSIFSIHCHMKSFSYTSSSLSRVLSRGELISVIYAIICFKFLFILEHNWLDGSLKNCIRVQFFSHLQLQVRY